MPLRVVSPLDGRFAVRLDGTVVVRLGIFELGRPQSLVELAASFSRALSSISIASTVYVIVQGPYVPATTASSGSRETVPYRLRISVSSIVRYGGFGDNMTVPPGENITAPFGETELLSVTGNFQLQKSASGTK